MWGRGGGRAWILPGQTFDNLLSEQKDFACLFAFTLSPVRKGPSKRWANTGLFMSTLCRWTLTQTVVDVSRAFLVCRQLWVHRSHSSPRAFSQPASAPDVIWSGCFSRASHHLCGLVLCQIDTSHRGGGASTEKTPP